MSWSKLDDGFWSHPKVVEAGNEAAGAYARTLSYCGCHETDGRLSAEVAKFIGSKRAFDQCVRSGLMNKNGSGYVIPDYLDFNPSRAQLEEKRARDRMRKAADSDAIP